ncbi:MAG: transglutaminase domain-containing protein [Chloroflexi bacterium]|nr:MAG: transglutaminase domain-containing protein [Chloroflexota bacterium]
MEKLHSQQSRWWDWAAVSLHFFLLQTLASRLVATEWTPYLSLIQTLTYMGFVIGVALGYSRFRRSTVGWLTFGYMLVLLLIQWTLVIDQDTPLREQFLSVTGRLSFSTSQFLANRAVQDPLFFVAVMSIAFWVISSWAAFTLVRNQNYLGAVLPAAIGLLVIQNYDNASPGRLWFLAVFAFLALLLLGRLQFLQNKRSWRERHVFLSPDNSADLTSSMAVTAGLIILVAWIVPASLSSAESAVDTWNRLTVPWQEFTDRLENAVSALDSKSSWRRGEFFSAELALGRGFPLSDDVIFDVQVPASSADKKPPRYYWRGRVYDYFSKNQWHTTGTQRQEFSPLNGQLPVADASGSTAERFVFNVGTRRFALLYGPSQPVWFSRAGTVLTYPAGDSKDVLSWNASPALLPGETYQMDAIQINPTIQQLRAAGTEYPEWITSKYLQLPPNFSPRIKELAGEITAEADTPYDKAAAITQYLRESIEYAAALPETPGNKDTLEWVLFEYKKAYCVYYATADVLMLRSLGVPARMAVGFAQGTRYTEQQNVPQDERMANRYLVRQRHAHAWPEVYFSGIGWVEFEPTGNQRPLDRPAERQNSDNGNGFNPADLLRTEGDQPPISDDLTDEMDVTIPESSRSFPLYYLLPLLAVFAALTIFLSRRYGFDTRLPVLLRAAVERTGMDVPNWIVHWEEWVKLSPVGKAFESINFGLRQLEGPVPVHVTPVERAAKLSRILPDKAFHIKVLLDEHQTSLYTSRIADVAQARRAAADLRKHVILERIRYLLYGKPRR